MSDEPPRPGRRLFGRRFYLLLVVAIMVSAATVFAVVQEMHFDSRVSKATMMTPGFFTPKSAKAVSFTLPSLTAPATARTSFTQLLGKPLVLNMWASSCTVCTAETPAIERVARELGGRVTFVGIDTLDERSAGLAFVRRYGVSYRELFDEAGVVASGYGIPGLPVTVFVSPAGKVVGENIGQLTVASLRHYLEVLFGI